MRELLLFSQEMSVILVDWLVVFELWFLLQCDSN